MHRSDVAGSVDPALIRKVREGDIPAFEKIFAGYQRRVYNLIYRMVGNEQDAADLTQETFVRVFQSRHRLSADEAFLPWLRTIALNLCRDHFRRAGRRIRADSLDEPRTFDDGKAEREVEDWSSNPELLLRRKDLQAAVQRALSLLSEDQREVVVLHHIEGMDVRDVANALRIPEGTVKSRLARARDELKRKLGHYIAHEPSPKEGEQDEMR